MLSKGVAQFAGKRVLLLQGPVGPFFHRLATDLRAAGASVYKVNFNAGDWLFYPRGAIAYRGTMDEWPAWFDDLLQRLGVDVVMLFGDCRPIHRVAHAVATRHGLEIGVFEEGYIRPDYITLEVCGVNGFSRMSRSPEFYCREAPPTPHTRPVGRTYWYMVWYGFGYFTMGSLGRPWFRHYQHHRPMSLLEAVPWLRSVWRKLRYGWQERGIEQRLIGELSGHFYLVPLQVFNDSQVTVHAKVVDIPSFIQDVLRSFAAHGPAESVLVFKHHPMDRGYCDYTHLITRLADELGVAERVLYIHDQHLPSLLDHTRGVVLINSTVGLSALLHGAATKVCGNALYDMPGLTYQGPLDDFWAAAPDARPNEGLFRRFRAHLIEYTQLNGSFYKPLPLPGSRAGLVWRGGDKGVAVIMPKFVAGGRVR